MLIDLDDFKTVNDSFGHAAGDQLLTVAAQRFDGIVRPQDTIARLGGDEFGVLCEDVGDARTAAALAVRLQAACAAPVPVTGSSLTFSASIGVTWSRRTSAPSPAAAVLLAEADAALYRAQGPGPRAGPGLRRPPVAGHPTPAAAGVRAAGRTGRG
jgi:diguanylate cyclase (GGDEF)-like protein